MTRDTSVTQKSVRAMYLAPMLNQKVVHVVLVTSVAHESEYLAVKDRGQLPASIAWRPASRSKTPHGGKLARA